MSTEPGQAASHGAAARIGRWIIPAIPFGWNWIAGFGIQRGGENVAPSNVYLKEDELLAGNQLILYIQAQITVMQRTFKDPAIAGPVPAQFPGAEDCAMLMLRHQPLHQVSVFQVQHYVRSNRWIGIVTLTTLEDRSLSNSSKCCALPPWKPRRPRPSHRQLWASSLAALSIRRAQAHTIKS
jgi:hypothetical protein